MEFKERVIALNKLGYACNDQLWAGSPMIYKCCVCGGISDTRPESYDPRFYPEVETVCDACKREIDLGITKEQLIIIKKEIDKEHPKMMASFIDLPYSERPNGCHMWLSEVSNLSK